LGKKIILHKGGKMGYIEDNLLPDEKVIAKAKIHWIIFIMPIILLFIGLFFALISRVSSPTGDDTLLFSLICIWSWPILGFITLLTAILVYFTTEFALTNKRVIAKAGILSQHSLEIVNNKIESITVSRSILGRILNYGTMTVIGSGGTRQSFKNIAQPMELRQKINTQIAISK
jgi:uncharacterized membrane protein YdbT with pleckstrin-like domain